MIKTTSIRHLAALSLAVLAGGTLATEHQGKPKPERKADKASATRSAPAEQVTGRDWRAIDLNKDNLISPDEMEKWLAANPGPLKK